MCESNASDSDVLAHTCPISFETNKKNSSTSSVGSTQYCTNDDSHRMSSMDFCQTLPLVSQDTVYLDAGSFTETDDDGDDDDFQNVFVFRPSSEPNEAEDMSRIPLLVLNHLQTEKRNRTMNNGTITRKTDESRKESEKLEHESPPSTPVTRRRFVIPSIMASNSPIPQYINQKSRQARAVLNKRSYEARDAIRRTPQRIRNTVKRYRVKRKQRSRIIVIPSNHRLKITWDFLTVLLTFVSAYVGHIYIRDRSTYEYDWWVIFTNIWFFIDILLNFFTDHRTSDGQLLSRGREVWGRYLTTWFVVDALSLLPWERMFLRPIIQMQNRRNIVIKWFFRSKAVIKVTRILRGRHFKAFGMVAKRTKSIGYGGHRLLQLIIKYVPKYILFYRNMKCVLILKTLRQIHFVKKIFRNLRSKSETEYDDASIYSLDELDSLDVQDEHYHDEDNDDTESFSSDLTVVLDEIETDYETSHDYVESDNESSFDIPPPLPKIYRVSSEPHMCKKCN
jgi:hypothetical protein